MPIRAVKVDYEQYFSIKQTGSGRLPVGQLSDE
jgi:hypothetical protein